ncbi:biosynthetic-type acetolactate synthase large subunit [Lutispora saccharofermentans]|uniref:Acetolactate synthase n=1 Tax=Lutispora saccharofermentans TaxID=3024236 RepID=A0ABT1NFH1_9FIRM|nr:biosynthetic-type acetolactate synthase large subunit [Lutispora saccharofermentans]MCQ1529987.1 biosynthetic-type acetolactate synthase large subunit [Lutispora saccharofermentans]
MEYTGAEIVLNCLKEQRVDTIFGYPGGAVIPLYDALFNYHHDFLHVLTCHEQGAIHAADGYARSTGKAGVCFATSGPGATNTVTGIATAYMDSVPLVVFTGQVPQSLLGRDSFQEIDITAVTFPITKYNYLVKSVEYLPSIIREAFSTAMSGRKGPVLIDIPKNIFTAKGEYISASRLMERKKSSPVDDSLLWEVVEAIDASEKPVIYAGGGVIHAGAEPELWELATKASIPVANTLMSLGCFPMDHPLSLGLVGMHGHKETNLAVTESDLIIAVGARFSDRVIGTKDKFAPGARIIHIDIDGSEIGKNKEVHFPLEGNVKDTLRALADKVREKDRSQWLSSIRSLAPKGKRHPDAFSPANILALAQGIVGKDSIIVTEVGQHQMWAAQYCKVDSPRRFLTSGGLGTMGYGLGASIGAQIANPDKKVLHIAGDGSFRMNCNELATVSKYKLPIITLLFNNGSLGMVRQWQGLFQEKRYSQTDLTDDVDYMKLASAYRLNGAKAENLVQLGEALFKAIDSKKATIIECMIDKETGVYPIVPPGMPINNMITGS